MKLIDAPLGLLINFHQLKLINGVHRLILPGADGTNFVSSKKYFLQHKELPLMKTPLRPSRASVQSGIHCDLPSLAKLEHLLSAGSASSPASPSTASCRAGTPPGSADAASISKNYATTGAATISGRSIGKRPTGRASHRSAYSPKKETAPPSSSSTSVSRCSSEAAAA